MCLSLDAGNYRMFVTKLAVRPLSLGFHLASVVRLKQVHKVGVDNKGIQEAKVMKTWEHKVKTDNSTHR